MSAWIAANAVTIVVISLLLAVIAGAVFSLVRDKKKKHSSGGCTGSCTSCGSGCAGCPGCAGHGKKT